MELDELPKTAKKLKKTELERSYEDVFHFGASTKSQNHPSIEDGRRARAEKFLIRTYTTYSAYEDPI